MITALTCNACSTPLSPTETRVICRVCANYDLCSNCHTLGRSSDSHEVQHETLILYPPTSISRDYHVPPAPPPPLPPRSGNNIGETSPHPCPAPLAARIPTAASKLLSSNNTPTRRLKDLSDAVFAHVSRTYPGANQHLLNPGQISNFYELTGKPLKENSFGLWINEADGGPNNTDPEVAHLYDRLGIEYSLITRVTGGGSQVAINRMPVLSHRGFRQLLVCEILEDPGHAHSFFNRLVRLAIVDDSGRAFGELPRGMFPAEPDPAFVAKVAAVTDELCARVKALIARLKREKEEKDRREWAMVQEALAQREREKEEAQREWALAQEALALQEMEFAQMAQIEMHRANLEAMCAMNEKNLANLHYGNQLTLQADQNALSYIE
ncbi:unnamed protein product [Tuber melanosporum]|uniref:(Perigord truffle) hypothetical protein n=1 Tax=Tuber melanosporum (strain Mel28) TaxID=656061 RepID=D5GFE4_TUBMM|nr:uncharacterized protein GSTUM_00006855001 [Tuber melanosporum]CAZ83237.1 unnamed protein product [Tuber melanosporum]